MGNTGLQALLFLINTLFDLYILVLLIRVILVWVGADYSHPITQLVVKLTNFLVKPLQKIAPTVAGVELATIILIIVMEMLKFLCIFAISIGIPNIAGLLIISLADALKLLLEIIFYAVLLQAILTWIQPHSPINAVLNKLTAPVIKPIRRVLPPINGIDFSPIPALIILQLLIILLNPLVQTGLVIATT